MSISQARMIRWNCIECGRMTPRLTWLAVDIVERPDLAATFMDLLEYECPDCGLTLQRPLPLLVLRLARTAPLIAGCTNDDELDPLEKISEVITTVQRELNDKHIEIAGPPVIATFDELKASLEMDIDTDIATFAADRSTVIYQARAYRKLLHKIEEAQNLRQVEAGLTQLATVESERHLREVLRRFPRILSDEAEQLIELRVVGAASEESREFASSIIRMVQLCRQADFRGAWQIRESFFKSFWQDTVFPRLQAYREASHSATWETRVQAAQDLSDVLPHGTHPDLEVDIAATMIVGLLRDESSDRKQSAEKVIELGQHALSSLDAHPEFDYRPALRLEIAMNMGMAFRERPLGDPIWNLTQGITYLEDALERFPPDTDLDTWAMALTNLAVLLIDRGQPGDYDLARVHLEQSLTHRSFDRNPHDWAYTQLNLGFSYSHSESGDPRVNLEKALDHTAKARHASRLTGDIPLIAYAELNLAIDQYRLSQMDGNTTAEKSVILGRAEASATEAIRLSSANESPLRYGRAWLTLGKVRSAQRNEHDAIEAFKTALTVLSASRWPIEARDASRCLIELAEEHGDIELAADAAAHLVEAAVAAITSRSRSEDRISEQSGVGSTDFRFAAHALVRAGRVSEALLAIERGKARELGLLTLAERVDLEMLSYLDPNLRIRVEEMGASFRSDILSLEEDVVSDRAEQFDSLLSEIEDSSTFETGLGPPTVEEISMVAQPGCPIVYLGSAPKGGYAIIVDRSPDGHVELDAIHAPDCGSGRIAELAMMGISTGTSKSKGIESAYLHAQMEMPTNIDIALQALSHVIGEQLLRPLSDELAGREAVGVTLVPAGLLGLMPLHAVEWNDVSGNRRCLIEDFDVTFAPSIRLHAACIRRAYQRTEVPIQFVGISNPLPHRFPLPGSELELELVQELVPTSDCLTLKAETATKQRIIEALPSATHVHIACHAGARFFDPQFSAALSLANEEELSALEIARLEVPARLVVASACETGVLQGYDQVDESLGLSSAFIAAGAAGVVSALWQVDDFATALVISRFYEELWPANKLPATALREAQLWIRSAEEETIDAYLRDRPALRLLRSRKGASVAPDGQTPFSAPSIWAAFTFSGA